MGSYPQSSVWLIQCQSLLTRALLIALRPSRKPAGTDSCLSRPELVGGYTEQRIGLKPDAVEKGETPEKQELPALCFGLGNPIPLLTAADDTRVG